MKHKTFRALLSLVLVCVLLIGWSPIRAQAMMPVVGWDSFAWNLADIIASGAIGIGTSPGSVPDDWNNMIEDAKQACQDFFGFVGDTMKIYRFFDGSSYKLYAKADFVEWLRGWMFDSGSVSCSAAVSHTFSLGNKSYTASSNVPCELVMFWRTGFDYYAGYVVAAYTPIDDNYTSLSVTIGDKIYGASCFNGYAVVTMMGNSGSSYASSHPDTSLTVIHNAKGLRTWDEVFNDYFTGSIASPVSSPLGISLGKISSPDKLLDDAYPEWVQNSIYIPAEVAGTEEEVLALPLGLGQTLDETQGLNQEQIWAGESTLEVEIEEALEGTVSGTTWADFTTWFGQKLEWIPKQILEGITSIFVPKEDFLTAKWEAIRAEFAFADSIMTSGDMILGVLNGIDPEPPVIYIDLGASEGSYDIGGEVPFLDLRWYERYKPTGDAIISAFLWLVFVWRMFIKLPGIIGGLPGDFVMQGVTDLGLADRLPARKKEYENQRQQNRRFFKK